MQDAANLQQLSHEELEELLNDLPGILRQLMVESEAQPNRPVNGSQK